MGRVLRKSVYDSVGDNLKIKKLHMPYLLSMPRVSTDSLTNCTYNLCVDEEESGAEHQRAGTSLVSERRDVRPFGIRR